MECFMRNRLLFLLLLPLFLMAESAPFLPPRISAEALNELYSELGTDTGQWLRKPGQQRWEQEDLNDCSKAFVQQWAEKHGLYDTVLPKNDEDDSYDTAFIIGATTPVMKERLRFLAYLWENGTRFDKIVWLTGERSLDPRVDQPLGETEADAARTIWEMESVPAEMKMLPVQFIASTQPALEGTLKAWLDEQDGDDEGDCLFITNQPYCAFHYAKISQILPASRYDYEVAGYRATGTPSAANILDTVARYVAIKKSYSSVVNKEYVGEFFDLVDTFVNKAKQLYDSVDGSPDPVGDLSLFFKLVVQEANDRQLPIPPLPIVFETVRSKIRESCDEEKAAPFIKLFNEIESEICNAR